MRRRVLGLIAVAVVVIAAVTFAVASRGGGKPSQPARLDPAQQVGDDANLMRQLQRDKLMKQTK